MYTLMPLTDIQVSAIDLSTQTFIHRAVLHVTLIQASRVFFDNSSVSAGILKIPTPTCFRRVTQPNMEQFAPGIAKKLPKYDDLVFPLARSI
jgi:hypothetical protein